MLENTKKILDVVDNHNPLKKNMYHKLLINDAIMIYFYIFHNSCALYDDIWGHLCGSQKPPQT